MNRTYSFNSSDHIDDFEHAPQDLHWYMQLPKTQIGYLISLIGFIVTIANVSCFGCTIQYVGYALIPLGFILPFIGNLIFLKEAKEFYCDLKNCDKLDKNESKEADFLFNLLQGEWTLNATMGQMNLCVAAMGVTQVIHTIEGDKDTYETVRKNQGLMKIVNTIEFYKNRKNGRILMEHTPMHTAAGQGVTAIYRIFHFDLIKLQAPDLLVFHDYNGNTFNFTRNSTWQPNANVFANPAPVFNNNPAPAYVPAPSSNNYSSRPPSYNDAPPSYGGDEGYNNGGTNMPNAPSHQAINVQERSIPDQIRELNDLKNQGILSEQEFRTAKQKVLNQ